MRVRSVVSALAVALGLMTLGQMGASANIVWCMADPKVQVNTASGANLSVNTQVYLAPAAPHLLSQVTEDTITAPDGNGGTLITLEVAIPKGADQAKIVASVNRYNVTAVGYGSGGSTVTVYLDVPAA